MNPFSKIWGYVALACAAIGAWYANNVFQQRKGKQEFKDEQSKQELSNIKQSVEIERELESKNEDEHDAYARANGWMLNAEDKDKQL